MCSWEIREHFLVQGKRLDLRHDTCMDNPFLMDLVACILRH